MTRPAIQAELLEHSQDRMVGRAWRTKAILEVLRPLAGADQDNPLEREPQWQDDALCAQTDPEIFFPEKGGSTREAKKICLLCPVKDQCLEDALANEERFGIWGGLSERERRRLYPRNQGKDWWN